MFHSAVELLGRWRSCRGKEYVSEKVFDHVILRAAKSRRYKETPRTVVFLDGITVEFDVSYFTNEYTRNSRDNQWRRSVIS